MGGLNKQEFSDIDLMAYKKERKQVTLVLAELGYKKRKVTLSTATTGRHIYFHPKGWFFVDIFFDKLRMNHDINFRNRLKLDFPTLTPMDLLLEKLQIVQFSEKDLKDVLLLLRTHKVAEREVSNAINATYIAKLLSNDWVFGILPLLT
jgi:hypothetical protein